MKAPAEFWDREPVSDAERAAKLARYEAQIRQLGEVLDAEVTCPCGRTVSLALAYNCLWCGIYFCRRCASRHFGAVEGVPNSHPDRVLPPAVSTAAHGPTGRKPAEILDLLGQLVERFHSGEIEREAFSRNKLELLAELQASLGRLPSAEELSRLAGDDRFDAGGAPCH